MKDSIKIWKVNRPAISSTVKKYDHSVKQADRVIPAPRMFKRIANAGLLAELLPIIPPGADLSPASNLKPDQVGKIPGAMHEDGGWIGFRGWPTHQTIEADLALWSRWPGVGVGLSCRTVRGLDVDVTDAALSEWIEGKALDLLGIAPARIGRWPKVLLPYLGGPDRKMRVAFTKGEPGKPGHEAHGVEWLANGQFFVVAGKHPKEGIGPYEWRGGALAVNHSDFPTGDHGIEQVADTLARVTVEQVTALFDAIAAHVVGLGFTVHNKRAGAGHDYSVRTASPNFVRDSEDNRKRAVTLLKTKDMIVEKAGANDEVFKLAGKMGDLGLSEAVCLDAMREHLKITPRDHRFDGFLKRVVTNSFAYRQNDIGCDDPNEIFSEYLHSAAAGAGDGTGSERIGEPKQDKEDFGFPVYEPWQFKDRPIPRWLVQDLVRDKTISLWFSPKECFKTFALLDLFASVASGLSVFGALKVFTPGDVVLCVAEDPDDLTRVRFPAWCRARGIADPFANPFSDLGRLAVIPKVPQLAIVEQVERLKARINQLGLRPKLVGFDTAAKAMIGQDQDSATAWGQVIAAAEDLRTTYGCAVVISHHPKKDDPTSPRGSGANVDDLDIAWRFERVSKYGIGTQMHCEKMKGAVKEAKPICLLGDIYDIGEIDQDTGKQISAPAFHIATEAQWKRAKAESKKAENDRHELTRPELAATLRAWGACPGGINEWKADIGKGGILTKPLAEQIVQRWREQDDDKRPIAAHEVEAMRKELDRNATGKDGNSGFLSGYVVSEKPRIWAIAPTIEVK